jgi:hypothetical protein
LGKLDWFNQSSLTARLKLKVVQEQLPDVSCRINYEGQILFAYSAPVAAVADRGCLASAAQSKGNRKPVFLTLNA